MAPIDAFAQIIRTVFQALRYAGFVFIGVAVWLIGREVWSITAWCAATHWSLGVVFLLLFGFVFYALIARPALRYLRVPAAIMPPDLPALDAESGLQLAHLEARRRGVERYLSQLEHNPELADKNALRAALAACHQLRGELGADVAMARDRLRRFERDNVDPLLAPLDKKARETIRNEAMAVAVATAISPSGAADAFFVLWRNANMVAKLAQLYYGRPGVRGTFVILRDVSFAMFVANQMQGLTEKGVEAASGFLGKAASPIAGPIADGAINGIMSLRIGYVTMRRCRAFRAFTRESVGSFLQAALRETAMQSAGFATDLVTKVGIPILKLPVDAGKRVVDWVTDSVRGWLGWRAGPQPEGSAG